MGRVAGVERGQGGGVGYRVGEHQMAVAAAQVAQPGLDAVFVVRAAFENRLDRKFPSDTVRKALEGAITEFKQTSNYSE